MLGQDTGGTFETVFRHGRNAFALIGVMWVFSLLLPSSTNGGSSDTLHHRGAGIILSRTTLPEPSIASTPTPTASASSSASTTPSNSPSATPSTTPSSSGSPPPVQFSDPLQRWWHDLFYTKNPYNASSPLPPCHEYVAAAGLSHEAQAYLLGQYYPGDCRAIEDPQATELCRNGGWNAEQLRCDFGHAELYRHCEGRRQSIGAPEPVQICTVDGMPAYFNPHPHLTQRYEYAFDYGRAVAEVGQECMDRRIFVVYDPPYHDGGPRKVLINTLSGLRRIGKGYVFAPRVFSRYQAGWSSPPHGMAIAHTDEASHLRPYAIGPTLMFDSDWVRPDQLKPWAREHVVPVSSSFWQQRSHGTQPNIGHLGPYRAVWPTGVDTRAFNRTRPPPLPLPRDGSVHFITYVKGRNMYWTPREEAIINQIASSLPFTRHDFNYHVHYAEGDLEAELSRAAFALVLDDAETQGMALEEIMGAGVPMFINRCDPAMARTHEGAFGAVNVPWWEEGVTGMSFVQDGDIQAQFQTFLDNVDKGVYRPREYVEANIDEYHSAVDFVRLMCGKGTSWSPKDT